MSATGPISGVEEGLRHDPAERAPGRHRPCRDRAWMWGDAVFSIALGASMWMGWPLSGLRALGVLIGLKLISAGTVLLRVERGLARVDAGIAAVRARLDR